MRNKSYLHADIRDQSLHSLLYPLLHSEIRRPDDFLRQPPWEMELTTAVDAF